MNDLLNKIKEEFEIISSICAFEKFTDESDGIRIYNECLSFYTYSKRYSELCEIAEMLYIAFQLNIPEFPINFEDYLFSIIHAENTCINKVARRTFFEIDKLKLFEEIIKRIYFFKSQNKKIMFLNRVEWGEPRIYNGKFYCRRRLALYICGNYNSRIEPELMEVK